jgi:hypothetical protein
MRVLEKVSTEREESTILPERRSIITIHRELYLYRFVGKPRFPLRPLPCFNEENFVEHIAIKNIQHKSQRKKEGVVGET